MMEGALGHGGLLLKEIEEPFSILPLEDFVAAIELAASQMLANEGQQARQDEHEIGNDAVCMDQFMTVYVKPI